MKAHRLLTQRLGYDDGSFADIVIWQVPQAVPGSQHSYKYSLAYVVDRECVLRYDNERGKGDHRHWNGTETAYQFTTPQQLVADFLADIATWRASQ